MAEDISDFKIPEKAVFKLLKEALPDNVTISNEARSATSRIASIFIIQMTLNASDSAESNGGRSINNQDIIQAVTLLGLNEYSKQLVRFGAQRKRNAKRKETSLMKAKGGASAKKAALQHSETPDSVDLELHEPTNFQDEPMSHDEEASSSQCDDLA